MIHIFRRHRAGCAKRGKRSGSSQCPAKPPCPIHFNGTDGKGKQHKPQAMIDPATGSGVRDWSRASEIARDMDAPEPEIKPAVVKTTIAEAVGHFVKLKSTKGPDTQRKTTRLMQKFLAYMQAPPRRYQFMTEIKFEDLTGFCSGWTDATATKIRDLAILGSFFKYCNRCDFTPKNISDGLFKTMGWSDRKPPRAPFEPAELVALWAAVPKLADQFCRLGIPITKQTEAFALIQRYTGMDVSTTMGLPKAHVRGNKILTYRLKNGAEVWTVVPEWVIAKLMAAPHDSAEYFFWSGHGAKKTRATKWFSRLRKLLDLAGLQHRTPHNFRHHFAVEQLLSGTPIEDVARLLGHDDIQTTLDSYAAWIPARQEQLERHQQRVWDKDPLHQQMTKPVAEVVH